MTRYLEIMMVVSSILAIRSGTDENMAKKKGALGVCEENQSQAVHTAPVRLPGPGNEPFPAREEDRSPLPDIRSHRSFLDLTDPRPAGREGKRKGWAQYLTADQPF